MDVELQILKHLPRDAQLTVSWLDQEEGDLSYWAIAVTTDGYCSKKNCKHQDRRLTEKNIRPVVD
ncbi:hypothetical protein H6G20_04965 [Desertifilum sp. FACHB-1129]|nr:MULTISPECIES: hypothetical protein [Desertifilum]MBD2311037.1 hypothetical protein [Desertifilum sp. FACHB-1129]MBD2321442.1 hypothetical protein [Desertifilum sp. FACHB-866]MBD2331251.1 hypothetical protein [Desertifilum sp. FACHB-868]MDA0208836.1 hypothetical protein [Cyanobacteria bacterium FC1]